MREEADMSNECVRERESKRYILSGELVTETGLHVGSGYGSPRTDATVVRDFWERPYIPGSSFKGALRSTVERLIAGLPDSPVTSCQLVEGTGGCVSTDPERRSQYQQLLDQGAEERKLLDLLEGAEGLCDTCRLFGSVYTQSRLLVSDLPFVGDKDLAAGEIRHGVGIDRETLTARERFKYDFEALPSQLRFRLELIVERPTPLDLALLSLGLQEMRLGFVPLGGIRTRGLGRCRLELKAVRVVDLGDKQALLDFLKGAKPATDIQPRELLGQAAKPDQFIQDGLARLLQAV
jgi:CRISPR-associated RAMP protein (TIGR02581 family)